MKKIKLKNVFIFIIIIIAGVTFHQFYTMHHNDFKTTSRKYLFFFKDSIINKVDTSMSFSWVADQDKLNHFIYYDDLKNKKYYYELNDTSYNNYYIDIWEFNSLKGYNLNEIFINKQSNIEKSKFILGEVLDSESYCPISIKYFYKIDGMILNLSDNSKIIKNLKGKNYK